MEPRVIAAAAGILLILFMLLVRWRWRSCKLQMCHQVCQSASPMSLFAEQPHDAALEDVQLVHKLCPHRNVIQSYELEQKDSLDEHLDVLTKKLAEKEGRLRLSKSKIRETQNEIENLQAIDLNVRAKYKEIMESLRADLCSNEKECKKLQEQIEWVSRRRAELREEVRRGQRLYGEAAAELASNLAELQRGRVTDKPHLGGGALRHRKEPLLPHISNVSSSFTKTPPATPDAPLSHHTTNRYRQDY